MVKVLCVAEKSSVAKAVAGHLSGGRFQTRQTGNKYIRNYDFDYKFNQWSHCEVTMTAVQGHTEEIDFVDRFRKWSDCDPVELFDAPITKNIEKDKRSIADNIQKEARNATILFIWTDCDREGEYIGTEVRTFAKRGNPNIQVKRAQFSNIEKSHVIRAAHNPKDLDERQALAVSARMELDLRIGAALTRFQSLKLQGRWGLAGDALISYGSCQFPTLGFVVERYMRVKNFVPEPFWSLKLMHIRDGTSTTYNWDRSRLFDRMTVVLLFESCMSSPDALVKSVARKPTKKYKPLPLTTVELQKQGSRFLGMNSQRVMKAAEGLYTSGFISYPRTETDQYDQAVNLQALIGKQTNDTGGWGWGDYATGLLDGAFEQPRRGKNNDKAHPPIHPVAYAASAALADADQRKVYEFVVRHFLACCSEDAIGETTTVNIDYGGEGFHASGLTVLERNYLDVYPWDRWESSQMLPRYQEGERFVPNEVTMTDGKTSAPGYLTEPELIALMDANGIGTDATMAEHIEKIQQREYVFCISGGGKSTGTTRGRGRGRGRGGRDAGGSGRAEGGGGKNVFVPSNLGVALVEAYDTIAAEMSLSRPFLRKEMEVNMKRICKGELAREDVVHQCLEQYRGVYARVSQHLSTYREICAKYMI
ncbi:DNA topoisomerase [Orbilia oligospora]|nr:DNA topoisomerase [Orbilia oligospora]